MQLVIFKYWRNVLKILNAIHFCLICYYNKCDHFGDLFETDEREKNWIALKYSRQEIVFRLEESCQSFNWLWFKAMWMNFKYLSMRIMEIYAHRIDFFKEMVKTTFSRNMIVYMLKNFNTLHPHLINVWNILCVDCKMHLH